MVMTNQQIQKIMRLVDEYGRQRSLGNEYDNRIFEQEARNKIIEALKEVK
jgi:hypothetical protein